MKLKILFPIMLFGLVFLASCEKDKVQENRPPQITVLEYDAQEDSSPVDVIATIQASDADADALSFAIVTNDNDLFVISDRGELRVANGQSLDYDAASSHEIVISVSDGTETTTATITINVINTNQAPEIASQAFEVYEDASSTDVIGTLDAEDPDGDEIMFEIITNDNDLFVINSNGELFLADGASLDYETATSHEITVEVNDGSKTEQGVITFKVLNIPDAPYALDKTSFVLEFTTTMPNQEIGVGTDFFNDGYDYVIDWGDGSPVEHITDSTEPTHNYAEAGIKTVAINGDFPRVTFNDRPWDTNLTGILNWGTIEWESFKDAFYGCTELENYAATDAPDLTNVTDMSGMFYGAVLFNGDLSDWDVKDVINMRFLFFDAEMFNIDLSDWDVGNVTNMQFMFSGATSFNQNLGGWNIGNIETMGNMLDNSGLSQENYSNTLIGWQSQDNTPTGITLGAFDLKYCGSGAVEARAVLVDEIDGYGWTINGDSKCQT